ncbi:glycoside hydrolase family 13 protein [Microbacterium hominis]|uniref:glycoside hydrolase family 13 protein n=1 Tax=Microbacterium hominis TaxID=162426 RepID=UPI00196561E2|nr:glycoside hydrolase family 13 protein [Microbacterium hominis]QRY39838.1 glycoside hydrolase family 13 protein [Microbacterium hominis]
MTLLEPRVVTDAISSAAPWWQDAVVYQVYLRSFRDGDGDGVGDLRGLLAGLADIAALGCDAIWLNPCYVSPQADHGYDIADYRAIDPAYGSLEDFDALVTEAHRLGIRVLMDMVANHCSVQHAWFREALDAGPGSRERRRFHFAAGTGGDGEVPPNNWLSVFGGAAWTRIAEADGRPGEWYLHSFDAAQPDLNWRNPEVAEDFRDVMRFWFDRGVDGFRVDVAHGHVKAPGLPDWPGADDGTGGHNAAMWDQPEVHEIYRDWRAVGDAYPEPKYFVGEVWVPSASRLAAYLRPDELHQAFSFELLVQPWDAVRLREAITAGLAASEVPPAWTLSNHDVHRTVTRYGQVQLPDAVDPSDMISAARRIGPVDLVRGTRRAAAAAALVLALPGTVYLYQGEELGLPEVFDLPPASRQDPIWVRSGGRQLGRDGCRVPLPWSSDPLDFGFGSGACPAWLPQPTWFGSYARAVQEADAGSMLSIYRSLIRQRRAHFAADAPLVWLDARADDVLAFTRGRTLCVLNAGESDFALPVAWGAKARIVETAPAPTGAVAADSAAWYSLAPADPFFSSDPK